VGVSTWNLDPAHTSVEFAAKHMMITTVKGRLPGLTGALTLDEAQPGNSSVEVEFDAASIDTRNEQRDQHLRSGDFLDVESHPTIGFRSTKLEGAGFGDGAEFRLVGELTIGGVTRELPLDVTFEGRGRDPWGGERVSFSASARIDRRDFGLTWNAALETGGVLVGNEIKLQIEAQAVRA
jgi:polyisoprenoid-binding protein YceI